MNSHSFFGYGYLYRHTPQWRGPVIALSPEPVRPPIRIGAARAKHLPAQVFKPP